MLMTVMPYVGYVSILTVDHEDVMENTGMVEINLLTGEHKPHVHPQGVAAGIIANVGDGVPILQEGYKVYYQEQSGIKIEDVTVIPALYVCAYEEV